MKKIKAWISAARLRTLPLSISCILAASAVALQNGSFSYDIFWLAIAATLGFQVLSNFANDYGDGIKGTDSMDRVGPSRALQSGLLTAKELKLGMIVTAVATLLISSLLIFVAFGNQNFLLSFVFFNLGIFAVIAAITYTVGRHAYGYRSLGDLFVFLFFGLVGVMGCYFLYSQSLGDGVLLPAVAIGLLCTAVLNLNNMRDLRADSKAGKFTLAVRLGSKRVRYYHLALIAIAFLVSLSYFILYGGGKWEFLPMLAFIPLLTNVAKVLRVRELAQLDPELKKVALSTFLFALLMFAKHLF